MAKPEFLKALVTGTDFTCDMLRNTSCGKLTEAWPQHQSMPLASPPPTAATWPLVILAILCWTGCAGALAWLLFTHGVAHFSGHKDKEVYLEEEEDSSTEFDKPLLPDWSNCGLPCFSVRSIEENGGVEDFDIVTVGPDGFEVRPAGEQEFDVVTVSPEGFEVRPGSPKMAPRDALEDKAMHTNVLEPPMGTLQQGMQTKVLEQPPLGTKGMQTHFLEQPPPGTQSMQTTILEQPPLGTHNHGMQTTILEPPLTSTMHTTILEPPPI